MTDGDRSPSSTHDHTSESTLQDHTSESTLHDHTSESTLQDHTNEPTLRDQTVLVTGGAGFIGSHLVEALAPVNDVRVLDDCSTGDPGAIPDGVTLIQGDVRDLETVASATRDVDIVFHLAAIVDVERSVAEPLVTHHTNVDGTLAVLEAARRHDVSVVLASSAAVYGDPEMLPITVDQVPNPRSPYGADKLSAEGYAAAYAATYDLSVVTLRYFNVYGPGQRGPYSGVVEAFLDRAAASDPLIVHGDGEQTRDFIHVSDVVRTNVAAAVCGESGTIYNVGTGESVSINQLASIVRDVTGLDLPIDHRAARDGDVGHSRAAIDQTIEALGCPPRISLSEGIADLVARRGIGIDEKQRHDGSGHDEAGQDETDQDEAGRDQAGRDVSADG